MKIKAFLLVGACLFLFCSSGKNRERYNNLPASYSQAFHQGLRFGLFTPEDYDSTRQYPLLVYLHGSTDTTSWNLRWYKDEVQKDHPCFVLTPKSVVKKHGWGNSWMEEHTPDMSHTLEVVDSLTARYSIDLDRLYIYGASMGGFGTFSVLTKEPGKFAAAYAVCGGGDETKVKPLLHTPLWIFHGDSDPVVSVDLSRHIYRELIRLGGKKVRYTEYPGVKHNSWENVGKEETLVKWLFSQRRGLKKPSPEPVKTAAATMTGDSVHIVWTENRGDDIWFYRLKCHDRLLMEIDGNRRRCVLPVTQLKGNELSLTGVDFLFSESVPVVFQVQH